MRFLLITVFTMLLCTYLHGQVLEDVIYKKDGSILRGLLIEQDFANGRYKIQLQGGSIFSINKDDIEKLTKEAPLASQTNTPTATQTPATIAQPPAQEYPLPSITPDEGINGVFYIGSMVHTLTVASYVGETTFSYTGINLAGQYNFNKHLGLYADINLGKYSERKDTDIYGNTATYSGNDLTDESYTSSQVTLILSTNLYQGWQIFTGLGAYTEAYTTEDDAFSASGSDFQLGLGYSWRTLQILLRINVLNSSDYSDNVDSSTTGHLQLGFNF